MSELLQRHEHSTIRWKLLASTSAMALAGYLTSNAVAATEDANRPTVWIELGGQLNRLEDGQELFKPPFVALTPAMLLPPQNAEKSPRFGLEGSIAATVQPKDSDWIFSASVRYGRTSKARHVRHQSYPATLRTPTFYGNYMTTKYPRAARFTDANVKDSENHLIVDFQAGRDVGLGLFGRHASTSVSLGVRFAQFVSKSQSTLAEDPDWDFHRHTITLYFGNKFLAFEQPYHTYIAAFSADSSFHGLGPSLSLKSSVPFAGNSQGSELTFDWGMNGALLFGRQKTKTHHQTTALYHPSPTAQYATNYPAKRVVVYQRPLTPDHMRSRSVVVPNIGGFAGLSFKYDNAKISFGYRADFFFGAMDGGIDTRKSYDRNFYGPYATISIGLGG